MSKNIVKSFNAQLLNKYPIVITLHNYNIHPITHMHLSIPQQLNCAICMSLFKIPITTECGHSFCRTCLINSSQNRKACPICRNEFQSSPDKLKQDDTLSRILEDFVASSLIPSKSTQDTSFQTKSETLLLLQIKTDQLLLPYNRIPVTFELQNPILLNKCQKVVARQQQPFNKFGVISRISNLKRLRHNLYQCILQGKSFCTIQEESIVKKAQQQAPFAQEEFSYRTCMVKEILETCSVNLNELNSFLMKLKEIKDPSVLSNLYKQVDYNIFIKTNDPLALIYSIFELIDVDNKQKYRVLTLFDQEKRMEVIRNVLAKNKEKDVSSYVEGFVKSKKENGSGYSGFIALVIIFIILLVINSEDGEF